MPESDLVFSATGRGVAYVAQANGITYVVHNGKPGKPYKDISHLTISPDGRKIAHSFSQGEKLCVVVNGVEGQLFDDVWDAIYSPDSRHVLYLATTGERNRLVLDGKLGEEYRSFNGKPAFTPDSRRLIYSANLIDEKGTVLVIRDLATSTQSVRPCLFVPFVLNGDKSRIALVTATDGKQQVVDFAVTAPDAVTTGGRYDTVNYLGFGADGRSVTYIGDRGGKRYLVVNGQEMVLPENIVIVEAPQVRPDGKGAGIILTTGERNGRAFLFQTGSKLKPAVLYEKAKDLVYNRKTGGYAFVALDGPRCFVVVNGKNGPAFDMAVSPAFSPDGTRLVYRARKDGKRFVVVADAAGNVIRQHPAYDMVFSTVFTGDGTAVAYGVKDGDELWWKVEKL